MYDVRNPEFCSPACQRRADISSQPASRTAREPAFLHLDHPCACTCELRRAHDGGCGESTTPTVTPPRHGVGGACGDEEDARARATHLREVVVVYLSMPRRSARRPVAARARDGLHKSSCRRARTQTSRLAARARSHERRAERVRIAHGVGKARLAALRTFGERHGHDHVRENPHRHHDHRVRPLPALIVLDGGVHGYATERRAPQLLPSADIALALLRHGRDDQILRLARNCQRGRTRAGQTISTMRDTRWRGRTSPVAFARYDDLCEKRHAQSDEPPALPHTPKRQTPRERSWFLVLSCCLSE